MELQLEIQIAGAGGTVVPSRAQFSQWAAAAAGHPRIQRPARAGKKSAELTIRIVDTAEMTKLNARYRGRNRATNVLAFPPDIPAGLPLCVLGDVVICAPTVAAEAAQLDKPSDEHWAHMVVHGILHLCGYDHQSPAEAAQMETVEREILAGLGMPPPYATADA